MSEQTIKEQIEALEIGERYLGMISWDESNAVLLPCRYAINVNTNNPEVFVMCDVCRKSDCSRRVEEESSE